MVVYRASRTSGTEYRLEAAEGVTADFTYDASGDPIVRDLTFTIMVKGIQYTAFAQSVKIQQIGTNVYLVGQLTDLIDLNGLVYSGNVLSKALIQLDFDASDLTRSGTFTLVKAS
jgi:F420-0:gamma-glutamyl ligase-like protein